MALFAHSDYKINKKKLYNLQLTAKKNEKRIAFI